MVFSNLFNNIYIYISGLVGTRGKQKKRKKERKWGDVGEMQEITIHVPSPIRW